ncbi:hypothetical protein NC651_012401 [Populus alba x Populus x berolinensis]|nr:hypothetical protein NC651_012401 [Populus alba x Populus x berolinensis]
MNFGTPSRSFCLENAEMKAFLHRKLWPPEIFPRVPAANASIKYSTKQQKLNIDKFIVDKKIHVSVFFPVKQTDNTTMRLSMEPAPTMTHSHISYFSQRPVNLPRMRVQPKDH